MSDPFVVLRCAERADAAARCDARPSTDEGVAARAAEARAFLVDHGLWTVRDTPVIVVDVPISGALTVADLGPWLGPGAHGLPGILLGYGGGDRDYPVAADVDVITHELVHHALRQGGAREPRWVDVAADGRASNEPALIQEGLADFVAACKSDDPIVGRVATPKHQAANSLRLIARCPDDLSGEAHSDGLVLGSALWAARAAYGEDVMLTAIGRAVRVDGALGSVAGLARAIDKNLSDTPAGSGAWATVMHEHGLLRCREPRVLTPSAKLSATHGDFVIPAAAGDTKTSPTAFTVVLPVGTPTVTVSLRSNVTDGLGLSLRWHAATTHGSAALSGWPMHQAVIAVPRDARELTFDVASTVAAEVHYSDLRVALAPAVAEPEAQFAEPTPAPVERGCAAAVDSPALALLLAVMAVRRTSQKKSARSLGRLGGRDTSDGRPQRGELRA